MPGDDKDLDLIGPREKLAQWRHKGIGPAFYRLGRKIVYRGDDLNAWAEANRVDPKFAAANMYSHEDGAPGQHNDR
ncbi:MAG: helix-turn-helix domain-containing protein, partial [Paracoccaceae bacterium]